MSDYFGALMRLSGLAGGDARSAAGAIAGRTAPDPGEEIDQVAARAIPATALPGEARDGPTSPSPMPAPQHASDSATLVEPAVFVAQPRTPTSADISAADLVDSRTLAIRAAMRWVAADPAQAGADAGLAQAPRPTDPADFPVSAADAVPRSSAVQDERPVTAPPAPARAAVLLPEHPRQTPSPAERDEVIEVSIGAIHVRVDAPAVQTRQQPAPPAAAPVATTNEPRGALSRRALRRI